jgi:hypothetical protein
MSWSLFNQRLAPEDAGCSDPPHAWHTVIAEQNPDAAQQAEPAYCAIQAIVFSGALGPHPPAGRYGYDVFGHANPDHTPAAGMSPDYLQITVRRLPE